MRHLSLSPDAGRRKASLLVLFLGFGGLLLFLAAAATETLVALDRTHQEETQLRKVFLARLGALDQIRGQIYLSGTYIRDFLLAPDPRNAGAHAARLNALERESHSAVESYARSLEPEERQPFTALRAD